MDFSRNVINDHSNVYIRYGYLMFPISLNVVPKVAIGNDIFFSKSNYHVSLLCLEDIPEKVQIKIQAMAKKYVLKCGKMSNTFRLVMKADQKAIIVRVRFSGLKKLILAVNKNFGYHFTYPPTHITLFTLGGQTGIAVNTFKEYREISTQVSMSDAKRLTKSFKLIGK